MKIFKRGSMMQEHRRKPKRQLTKETDVKDEHIL
jgi:hypothetical protein